MLRLLSRLRLCRKRLAAALLVALVSRSSLPQTSRTDPPQPDATPSPEVLHVTAQLVLVDVAVEYRKTGKPLLGLTPQDFLLTEDNTPQALTSLSQDTLPLSVLLLFDLTDTVHPVLQHLADGASELLRHLRPTDEIAVMTFSSHTDLEQRFTRDRMAAVEGLDAASASYDPGEPTFLFEDLWQAARQSSASRLPDARRVQLWVTDGSANDQDTQRHLAHHAPAVLHAEPEATAALLHSNAVVSTLIERSNLHGNGRFGDLEHFADLTGGPVVYAAQADAPARLATLLDALRARYTLGYKPSQPRPPGTVCHLNVSLSPAFWAAHPDLHPRDILLRARQAYVR